MSGTYWIVIFTAVFFCVQSYRIPKSDVRTKDPVTVCYISTWAVYRPDQGKFTIDDLDPSLCTHLVYAFAGLNETTNTIKSLDPFNDLEDSFGKGGYTKATSLKSKFPHLKVTLAIGGWNEGSEKYSLLAASPEKRHSFIESVILFLRKFNFDGLDLDWEYPGNRGGKPEDKENFVTLVKELRTEMDKNGWILTAAIGAGKKTIDVAYDLPALSKNLDYIHLMCYDYHGSWDGKVGANAPLRSNSSSDENNVEFSVNYLITHGVSPKKLVLGVPFYGRTFKLKSAESGNDTESTGFQGPYTREDGFLGYNEICSELNEKDSEWQKWFDEETQTAFAKHNEKVIAYDDIRSIKEKVKLAVKNELAGVMVWSIDTDDFHGTCKEQVPNTYSMNYPLLRTVNNALTQYTAEKEKEMDKTDNKSIIDNNNNNNTINNTNTDPNVASKQHLHYLGLILVIVLTVVERIPL